MTKDEKLKRDEEIRTQIEVLQRELVSLEDESDLTPEEKEKVDKDFRAWSGGSSPDECEMHTISVYMYYSQPLPLRKSAVWTYLEHG